jgi:hypothetical protein
MAASPFYSVTTYITQSHSEVKQNEGKNSPFLVNSAGYARIEKISREGDRHESN